MILESNWRRVSQERALARAIAAESRALRRVADLEAAADLNSSVYVIGMVLVFTSPVAFVVGLALGRYL